MKFYETKKPGTQTTINPLYGHVHFSHILIYVTHFFLVIIRFSKKHHFLESLPHSLVAQIFSKIF
jgi:hypothetical protein